MKSVASGFGLLQLWLLWPFGEKRRVPGLGVAPTPSGGEAGVLGELMGLPSSCLDPAAWLLTVRCEKLIPLGG